MGNNFINEILMIVMYIRYRQCCCATVTDAYYKSLASLRISLKLIMINFGVGGSCIFGAMLQSIPTR